MFHDVSLLATDLEMVASSVLLVSTPPDRIFLPAGHEMPAEIAPPGGMGIALPFTIW